MPPNPRVVSAFRAMKHIGISEDKVKPVLKSLLKLYDKKWELIEEENYRALADAIFEKEEAEAAGSSKKPENIDVQLAGVLEEEEAVQEEPERPLKRMRLRSQEGQASPSVNNSSSASAGSPLKRPETEEAELAGTNSQGRSQGRQLRSSAAESQSVLTYVRNKGKQPVSGPSQPAGPENCQPNGAGRVEKNSTSRASNLKEPKTEPGIEPSPQPATVVSHALIKPKDEPYTLDTPQSEVPLAVVLPEQSNNKDSSSGNASRKQLQISGTIAAEPQDRADEDIPDQSNGMPTNHELVKAQNGCYPDPKLEIASSTSGEVKVYIDCDSAIGRSDFHLPGLEDVLELVEDKCLKSCKAIDPEISVKKLMKNMCECLLELGTQSNHEVQETTNVDEENGIGRRSVALVSSNGSIGSELDAGDARPEKPLSPPCDGHNNSSQTDQIASVENCVSASEIDPNIIEHTMSQSPVAQCGSTNFELDAGEAQPEKPQSPPCNGHYNNTLTDETTSAGNCVSTPEIDQDILEHVMPQSPGAPCQSNPDITGSCLVADITKGQEKVMISLVNEVNDKNPPSFNYIANNVVFQNAYVNFSLARIGDDNSCSTCSGDCLSLSTPCPCAYETGGDFAYTKEGLVKEELLKESISMNRDPKKHCQFFCKECPLERSKNEDIIEPCKGHLVRNFIKECWWKCGCSKQCGNRVVQRGITRKLQVFMAPGGKGWGLRTLEDLPRGAFVCEYVGEVLTNAELFDRVEKSPNGEEHSYPVLLDADWGSERVLKDEEALCLDATFYGNVARFVNHRCFDSNMVEIPVEIETPDHHYYHLAFFTTRKVKAMEELTWDYGIDFDDHEHPVKAFRCKCGSKFCRDMKRPRIRRKNRGW